ADEHAFGQRVNKTYPRADYFLGWDEPADRFISLLFGDPREAPTSHEVAMNHADAAALQTLATSRRVGASILSGPSVVALGCNEVPPGEDPDVLVGIDFSEREKKRILLETLNALRPLLDSTLKNDVAEDLLER